MNESGDSDKDRETREINEVIRRGLADIDAGRHFPVELINATILRELGIVLEPPHEQRPSSA